MRYFATRKSHHHHPDSRTNSIFNLPFEYSFVLLWHNNRLFVCLFSSSSSFVLSLEQNYFIAPWEHKYHREIEKENGFLQCDFALGFSSICHFIFWFFYHRRYIKWCRITYLNGANGKLIFTRCTAVDWGARWGISNDVHFTALYASQLFLSSNLCVCMCVIIKRQKKCLNV